MKHWLKSVCLAMTIVGGTSSLSSLGLPWAKESMLLNSIHPFLIAASATVARAQEPTFLRPPTTCPDRLEDLTALLLRDLPSYANRVSQRAYIEDFRITDSIPGTIILAGRPEYQPIELPRGEYVPEQDDTTTQVFFTTLERQYASDQVVDLQHYYWLFLTRTEVGWQFVLLFSSLGQSPTGQPPTPPQDASQGVVARAIRLWLRDCQAGSIQH